MHSFFTSVVEELVRRGLGRRRIFLLSTMSRNQPKKGTLIFAQEDPALEKPCSVVAIRVGSLPPYHVHFSIDIYLILLRYFYDALDIPGDTGAWQRSPPRTASTVPASPRRPLSSTSSCSRLPASVLRHRQPPLHPLLAGIGSLGSFSGRRRGVCRAPFNAGALRALTTGRCGQGV